MANVIKYNTGTVPVNAIKSGNFDIGVNQGGYGLTSDTGYWNGKTPNVSGYTIYQANGGNSPILYVAANDAELIVWSNRLGGSGNTTIGQALTFFNSSSTLTCVNVDTPSIVTSGLTLYLDAGFTPSYPKTGTTWKDVSGSGYNGTLVNGPVYSGDSGGYIYFNGINNSVTVNRNLNISTEFTIEYVLSIRQLPTTGQYFYNFANGGYQINGVYGEFGVGVGNLKYFSLCNLNASGLSAVVRINDHVINTIYYVSVTYQNRTLKGYVNGVLRDTSVLTFDPLNNTSGITTLGAAPTNSFNPLNLYLFKYYNRALSVSEVLQNYYAGLQRLIPTDGLVLYLDGNNTNKQVMTASTANDISGYNNYGTLTNGVALVSDGQRSFSFDGTDDYIRVDSTILQDSGGTINVWYKPLDVPPSGFTAYIFAAFGTNDDRFYLSMGNDRVITVSRGNPRIGIGGGNNLLNVWYNLTMTWDSTTFSGYLNGVQFGVTTSYTASGTVTTFIIGGYTFPLGTQTFNGNIGQVRIYNRPITATEVSTIYTATKSRYGL